MKSLFRSLLLAILLPTLVLSGPGQARLKVRDLKRFFVTDSGQPSLLNNELTTPDVKLEFLC